MNLDKKTIFEATYDGSLITFTLADCTAENNCIKITPKVIEANGIIPTEVWVCDSRLKITKPIKKSVFCNHFYPKSC